MKRIIIAFSCFFLLASCASISATNIKNRKIAHAVYQEGKAYFAQKKYQIALRKFLEAEKTIPDDRYLQYDLGFTYYLKKKYALAEIHFEKSLELKSDFMPAINAIGVVYLEQKQWDKAIERFEICVNTLLYATPHYAFTNLGWAYIGKNNYKLAKEYFLTALENKPNYPRALHGYVRVSLEINLEHSAIEKLEEALMKFPDSMIIHYDLARLYEKVGQYSKAKEYWEEIVDRAPDGSKFIAEAKDRLKKM